MWISLAALRDLPLDPQSRCRLLQLAALQPQAHDVQLASPLQLQLEAAEATASSMLDALEQQEWDLAVERQNELRSLIAALLQRAPALAERLWPRYGELLCSLAAALHPRLLAPATDPPSLEQRAGLCWRMMQLFQDAQQLPWSPPDWLVVVEQQLVQEGERFCRELRGRTSWAEERALTLALRLTELLDPVPLWLVELARQHLIDCLDLGQLSAETPALVDGCRRLVAWLRGWPLLEGDRVAMASVLERLELGLQLLDYQSRLASPPAEANGRPERRSPPLQLVVELEASGPMDPSTASVAGSCFNLAPLLTADVQSIEQQLSRFIQGQPADAPAAPATNALLESLQPLWRQGRRLPLGSFALLSYALQAWHRQLGDRRAVAPPPAAEAALQVELDPRELSVLLSLSRSDAGLDVALVELRRQHHNSGFWLAPSGPTPWYAMATALDGLRALQASCGFYASAEAPLETLRRWGQACMALLLAADCWSIEPSCQGMWLALAQQVQVQASGAALGPLVGSPDPITWLASLTGREVLYVGWHGEDLEDAHQRGALFVSRPFGLRILPAPDSRHPLRPHRSFTDSLDSCLTAVQELHARRPFDVVCCDAGAYRLPLLQALRQRYGVQGLATAQPLTSWLQPVL